MKTKLLLMLAAVVLMGCQKDNLTPTDPDDGTEKAVNIRIYMGDASTKGVEDGHPGGGTTIVPKVNSVTIHAYNDFGKLISRVDLTPAQQTAVLFGAGNLPGSVTGAVIGLPVGTKKMDVVINSRSDQYTNPSANINYFNYRTGETPMVDGKSDFPSGSIFDRTFLTTDKYGEGYDIVTMNKVGDVYEGNFIVKPMLARFEVFNSINVKPEEEYKDSHKQTWKKINATDFLAFLQRINPAFTDIDKALKPGNETNNKYGILGPEIEKESETVTKAYYYIPAYYWFTKDNSWIPGIFDIVTAFANEAAVVTSGWVKSPFYDILTTTASIKWYPNVYHAVDVEEIFVNNVRVRSNSLTAIPYLHPWPNAHKATGWPHWYKAYHPYGWHIRGSSADNTFLCMGNLWDRIADNAAADKLTINWTTAGLNITEIVGTASLSMYVLTGKAIPIANMSEYGDVTGHRNLGIKSGQSAAYHIYPQ